MMVGDILGKENLIVIVNALSPLRIFTLGGSSLRVIMEYSLQDIKVKAKFGLIILLFCLEGFLFVKFFVNKTLTHKI